MPRRPVTTHCGTCGYPSGSYRHAIECGPSGRHGRAWVRGLGPGDQRVALSLRMWPGITAQLDALCSCTLAAGPDGVYQVKVRDTACRNHGGDLAAALARMARLP